MANNKSKLLIEENVSDTDENINRKHYINKIALGSDHGGYELKEHLKSFLLSKNYKVIDCGTNSLASVDYPDIAYVVAKTVAGENADVGIMIDGAGIGSCIACNKVRGIRAALCYNEKTIINSREHNNANVLTLGAPFHTKEEAENLILMWINTPFAGGRHLKRVNKITEIENKSRIIHK